MLVCSSKGLMSSHWLPECQAAVVEMEVAVVTSQLQWWVLQTDILRGSALEPHSSNPSNNFVSTQFLVLNPFVVEVPRLISVSSI